MDISIYQMTGGLRIPRMWLLAVAALLLAAPDPAPFIQDVAWSPDGTLLACSVARGDWDRGGDYDIYVLRPDGSGVRRLTDARGADLWISWSPDGKRIAFSSRRTGAPEIYVMNADGTSQARLTDGGGSAPSWSPDGKRIAFMRKVDGQSQIFVMSAGTAGGNSVLLASTGANEWNPIWSPDGTRILFYSDREGQGKDQIYTVLADGSNLHRLTAGEGNNIFPAWSPDGGRIVFGAVRAGGKGIYVMNADGTGERKLYDGGYLARFSPDGRSIAILDGNWPSSRLSIGKADGTEMRSLPPL